MLDTLTYIIFCSVILIVLFMLLVYIIKKPKVIIEKYDTGQKRYKYYLKNGKKNGQEEVYYRSGKLNKVKPYVDGMLHGQCITYYESGVKYIEANYENNKLVGPYTIYEENGTVKEVR